ncbi:ImmA/IrrE family metallo-endopeptidase [Mesorhizobium sp. B4-1-1]|uniref:ImmA/IrrE family metallo-endopeptidase n=1 Tax=Mesorhizobium sp. B4-1-1 TaxID=2589890 RepID=UPI00112B92CD|nr:ImmA/IrrE family metallo-endopeptidase [Mesorhizobium sp. B4-1-1]TPI22167.1 ImmA/IrrE family metallo-endopeptidase [Mesorhizobium sp. B4-1-1]
MTRPLSPERWAFEITHLLNAVFGADRFPIDIPAVAREYTAQRFPDDPIISVQGDNLPGFDGALFKAPTGRKGWGIIYNNRISSKGRINFTLAHEFGHFLLHRSAYPNGFRCGEQDVVRWDSEYGQVEHQANVFAANFLMPLDDFRRQIPERDKVDLDMIAHCADRYRVSLIAATLRWLSYTQKRAVLVVSRDGFILWARSSPSALKTGAFFRTSAGPIEIPATSLPVKQDLLIDGRATIDHGAGVWFREPVREMTVFAEQYDFAISLLLLDDAGPSASFEAEDEPDVFDKMMPQPGRREW